MSGGGGGVGGALLAGIGSLIGDGMMSYSSSAPKLALKVCLPPPYLPTSPPVSLYLLTFFFLLPRSRLQHSLMGR